MTLRQFGSRVCRVTLSALSYLVLKIHRVHSVAAFSQAAGVAYSYCSIIDHSQASLCLCRHG